MPRSAHTRAISLSALLAALDDGVVIVAPDGEITAMNAAAHQIFGVSDTPPTLRELRSRVVVRDHATGTVIDDSNSALSSALRGEEKRGSYTITDPRTGDVRVLSGVATSVREQGGAVISALLVVRDVTHQLEAERQKQEFLSIVTHELKTPLTPLKALAQLLRSRMRRVRTEGRELDLDSFEKNLVTIERQVDRMNGLVNDLLEVSRAGRGRFELLVEELDLAPLVREVVSRYVTATAEEGRHRFAVDVPETLPIRGDPVRLEQVLMNLVGNAVKYTPRGGEISVSLRSDDGAARLEITDDGIGVSAEDLARVGKPFVRGKGKAATFSGMGIGLHLAQLVAEGHGGGVELSSEGEDKGATVRMWIPIV